MIDALNQFNQTISQDLILKVGIHRGHSIAVTVNGKTLPYDPTGVDGWRWGDRSNGEIAILGNSCVETAALENPLVAAEIQCAGD